MLVMTHKLVKCLRHAVEIGLPEPAVERERERRSLQLYALMITDVLSKGTDMLVAGDATAVARSFNVLYSAAIERAKIEGWRDYEWYAT